MSVIQDCKHRSDIDGTKFKCSSHCLFIPRGFVTESTCRNCAVINLDNCYQNANRNPVKASKSFAYAITTVPQRFDSEFQSTVRSLKYAGFDDPLVFVDANHEESPDYLSLGLETVYRSSRIKTSGNWILAAWELYIRNTNSKYFAIFQDDFVTYKNLRTYLERCEYPEKGYMNLYTFPENQKHITLASDGSNGWHESNQKGRGAVALVFSNDAMRTLLSSSYLSNHFRRQRRDVRIDAVIVEAMRTSGWKEYVHKPSLVQHIGIKSSMGSKPHAKAADFQGEEFDAIKLLPENLRPAKPKRGLGDAVESALSSVGITKELVSEWVGDCNCSERQERLNKLGEWASSTAEKGVTEGKRLLLKLIGK